MPEREQRRPDHEKEPEAEPERTTTGGDGEDEEKDKNFYDELDKVFKKGEGVAKNFKQRGGE